MSYHSDRDRDRRDSSRGRGRDYDDPADDYSARVELLDLPAFLLEDRALCKRFINHYFTRLTHFPLDGVELIQMDNMSPEAGEIAGLRCYITLPERDAWARLKATPDPPVRSATDRSASGRSYNRSDRASELLDLEWKHYFNPKYMPTWSSIQRYQGNVQGESIRQLLFNRKVTFRLDREAVIPILPRPPFVIHDDTRRASTRKNNISSVRAIDRRPTSESEQAVDNREWPVEPVRVDIVGPKDDGRPISWDVEDGQLDDIAMQQNSARSSIRQGETSQADLRPADDFVGFPEHDEKTDPWIDRPLKGDFDENLKWLETYREYLLRPEIRAVKPSTTIPSFVEERTVVVWQLAKTWTRKHLALYFTQFGRIDDVKVRQVADGWAPAGRVGYISFMSARDRQEILRKCLGHNFPKQVVRLRKTAYWKVADDLEKGGPPYLLVGEARQGEWCPVASKLVNGKWDPATAGRERYAYKPGNPFQKRPLPAGPSRPPRPASSDALDYSSNTSYNDPPAGPSERGSYRSMLPDEPYYSARDSYDPLPPPATASGRTSPRSPRRRRMSSAKPDVVIYLPVDFREHAGGEGNTGSADTRLKIMRVLAIPEAANEEQMKKMFQQFGSVEKIEISGNGERNVVVKFRASAGLSTAQGAARKANPEAKFPESYELPVKLADFQPEEEVIWTEWDWKNRRDVNAEEGDGPASKSARQPPKYASAVETSGSTRAVSSLANTGDAIPQTEGTAVPMNETSALLNTLSPSRSPSPHTETTTAARRLPPPPVMPISAKAPNSVAAPSPTDRPPAVNSFASAPSLHATSTNATGLGTASSSRPMVAAPPPQPARAVGPRSMRAKVQGAMAALMGSQVGLFSSEPAKRPNEEETTTGGTAAKRKRFE